MSASDHAISDAMSRIVDAPTRVDAIRICQELPMPVLRGLADLLYLDTRGRRPALIDRVTTEARS